VKQVRADRVRNFERSKSRLRIGGIRFRLIFANPAAAGRGSPGTAMSEVGPEVTSLVKAGSVLVDQSGLLDQADRECRERGGPSAPCANDTSQGCHDRFEPCPLRERTGPHGGGRKNACGVTSSLTKTFADWRSMTRIPGPCSIGSAGWAPVAEVWPEPRSLLLLARHSKRC
jgi:hypothetical protein